MEKSFAIRLLVRVQNRLSIARPSRQRDVSPIARRELEDRLARQRLRTHGSDVLRIALQHLLDPLVEFLLLRIRSCRIDDQSRLATIVTLHEGDLLSIR